MGDHAGAVVMRPIPDANSVNQMLLSGSRRDARRLRTRARESRVFGHRTAGRDVPMRLRPVSVNQSAPS